MGLFDMFLSEERRIAKEQRTLTNRDKQPEDRETAARWLVGRENPKAFVALLTRFDMNLENQLKDRAEKDLVYGLLGSVGQPIRRPLDRHLTRCRQIATPLRLFVELAGDDDAVVKVFDLLDIERKKDDFKPQKKNDLLVWLVDKRHAQAIDAAAPFLHDFDENVRCTAAEVMIVQRDDAARPILEAALANPDEESNRLRTRLAEVFSQRRWKVDNVKAVEAALPEAWVVRNGKVAAA